MTYTTITIMRPYHFPITRRVWSWWKRIRKRLLLGEHISQQLVVQYFTQQQYIVVVHSSSTQQQQQKSSSSSSSSRKVVEKQQQQQYHLLITIIISFVARRLRITSKIKRHSIATSKKVDKNKQVTQGLLWDRNDTGF